MNLNKHTVVYLDPACLDEEKLKKVYQFTELFEIIKYLPNINSNKIQKINNITITCQPNIEIPAGLPSRAGPDYWYAPVWDIRGALFRVFKAKGSTKNPPILKDTHVFTYNDTLSVKATGPLLSMQDRMVYWEILKALQTCPVGFNQDLSAHALLKALNRSKGAHTLENMKETLHKLYNMILCVKTTTPQVDTFYVSPLIYTGYFPPSLKHKVALPPILQYCLHTEHSCKKNMVGMIKINKQAQIILQKNSYALWLHAWFSSHSLVNHKKHWKEITYDTIQKKTFSTHYTQTYKFRQKIHEALDLLQQVGFVAKWEKVKGFPEAAIRAFPALN